MVSRRSFLWMSSFGAAAAGAPAALAQPAPRGDVALPASIAGLSSMRDRAVPISRDERAARLERAKRLMAGEKIDALMLTGGTSMVYFTGMRWWLSERLTAVVVPVTGSVFVVTPAFEEERTREQLAEGPLGKADVLTWHEHEGPYELVAQGLRARGIATGRLGIEETVRFVFSAGVAQAAPALTLTSGTPVTAGCRMVKDSHETALMRLAADVTWKAYQAVWKALEEGMTQADFARLVQTAHQRLGFSGGAGVQVGRFSALPHGSVQPQVIREGAILLIDGGCSVEGYASDISRTFVLGKPTEKMKQVFEADRRAQDAALAAARPGVPCEAVDRAARKVIEDAGFGPDYAYFTHRVGHGMGMDGHEWPYLVRGNTLPLAPGMTFSNEPGIYIRGEFGVRVEDDMLITESGAELFTPQSPSLEQPFET
jgi:Xaa-Pro dipeptidase